jgi:hypothetical protein
MRYETPKITLLGPATVTILGCGKGTVRSDSGSGCSNPGHTPVSAYEADE